MRISADQARQRLRPQGGGMRSKAMPLVLLRTVKAVWKKKTKETYICIL